MQLSYLSMKIVVEPIPKHRLKVIADMLFNININYGKGGIACVQIVSVAGNRISGIVTREIPLSPSSCRTESRKFSVKKGTVRFLGRQLTMPY